jgi:hypothetical protein
MHAAFLDFLLRGRAFEALKEFGEADHVNQLMGNDIERKREKVNAGIPLDRFANNVILQADLEIIAGFAAAQAFMRALRVAVNLGKSRVRDFLFLKISQGLNVVTIPFPLGCRDLIVLAEEFFRDIDGLPQDGDFVLLKGESLCRFSLGIHRVLAQSAADSLAVNVSPFASAFLLQNNPHFFKELFDQMARISPVRAPASPGSQ